MGADDDKALTNERRGGSGRVRFVDVTLADTARPALLQP